jgi:hypothetical protein
MVPVVSASWRPIRAARRLQIGVFEKETQEIMRSAQIPWKMTTPEKLSYSRLDGVMKSQRSAKWSYLMAGGIFVAGVVAMLSQLL